MTYRNRSLFCLNVSNPVVVHYISKRTRILVSRLLHDIRDEGICTVLSTHVMLRRLCMPLVTMAHAVLLMKQTAE